MPAGSLQKMDYAFAYGADAVYLGVPYFSLRARENEFNLENLAKARETATRLGKKIYLTANIFSKNRKLKPFSEQLKDWVSIGPDAFIMSDPGLMMEAREMFPDINLHLSVQANCMNWKAVKFWHKSLGVSRIILSRELHINDVKEIKQRVPEIELEAFVHGSICIAYSGRCLMSSYMSNRDANQGVCDNSCREKFKVYSSEPTTYYAEDMRDPGQIYPISEDENGTYLMNAKDLCLIDHLKEIHEAGVCSFKVEGRTKSLNYVSLVSKAYRKAIDDMFAGKDFDPQLHVDLSKIANRGYTSGFMIQKRPGAEAQNYNTSIPRNFSQKFAGLIKKTDDSPKGFLPVEVRNRIEKGKTCEILFPESQALDFKVSEILNSKMEIVDTAHGGAGLYYFKLDSEKSVDQVLAGPGQNYGILSLLEASS